MYKKGVMNEVIYCHTGVGLNEEYVKEVCQNFNWKLNIVSPAPFEYETFVQRYGFPRPTSHSWIMQRLKLNPIRKWYNKEKHKRDIIFLSGIRISESNRRRMNFGKKDNLKKLTGMTFAKPILIWSNDKVKEYIKTYNLKISPIYDILGLGGDCLCGAFTKKEHAPILKVKFPILAERFIELEKNCRGTWGQYQPLQSCNRNEDDGVLCSDCMIGDKK